MAFRDSLKKYRQAVATQAATPQNTSPAKTKTTQSSTSRNTGSESSGSSFIDSLAKYREAQASSSLQGWAEYSSNLIEDVESRSQNWFDENVYQSYNSRVTKLLALADDWRKQYAGDSEAIAYIDSIVDALDKAQGYAFEYRNYYSNWNTPDEYQTAMRQYGYQQNVQGMSYGEIQDRLSQMEDGEEKEWLSQYAPSVMTPDDYRNLISGNDLQIQELEAAYDEIMRLADQINMEGERESTVEALNNLIAQYGTTSELKQKIEALKAENWQYQNAIDYNFLGNNADYSANSQAATKEATAGFGIGFGTSWLGVGDPVYDYINNLEGARNQQHSRATIDRDSPYFIYDHMKPEEIANYNYLYNTAGKEAANAYLEHLEYTLNQSRMAVTQGNAALLANEAPVLASALSVPINLVSGIGALDVAGQNIVKGIKEMSTGEYAGPIDYNRSAMNPTVTSSTIRSTVAQNIADRTGTIMLDESDHPVLSKILNGKSLGDVYQLGMSMADSAAVAAMSPVFGTAGTAFLGGSAASQGILDAVANGATDDQAIAMGVLNGAFEMLFEKVSLENLLKGDAKNIVHAILKQGFFEGTEELNTTIANTIADIIVMADSSNWQKNIDAYVAQGLSPEEAQKQAFLDAAIQAGWDFVGGTISGGIMGGTSMPIMNAQQRNANAEAIYGADPGALVSEALEINPDNTYAQRMQGRLDKGKTLSGGQLNRLVQQNEKALTAQDMSSIQSAAETRLTELGETGDTSAIAAALAKQAAGKKLSRAEQQTIAGSKYGQRVANELNTENIQSGEYSSAWAENIDTQRINVQEYSRLVEAAQQPQSAAENTGSQVATQSQKAAQAPQAAPVETPAATVQENRTVSKEESVPANDQQVTGKLTGKESLQVAEDGVTRQESTGKAVMPQKIVSISNGNAVIQTDNGEISAEDIAFGDKDTDMLWRSAIDFHGINPAGANGIIRAYRSGDSVTTYLSGAAQEFRNGYYNLPSGGQYADKLTSAQREIIYDLGQKAAGENTAKAQAFATKAKKAAVSKMENATSRSGKVHFDRKGRTFDAVRETALKTMEQLSAALGIDFYVYESYKNAAGKRVYKNANGNEVPAPNGYYDTKDGSIHIDLNAGTDGKGTMLFTIAHEFTHFIKQWSPAKFKVLANLLINQYSEQNVSVNKLVDNQIAKAKKNGRELSWDDAFEEVVADSMEAMLRDGNVVQMMADLKEQDKTLWQKIRDWFQDLAENLKALLEAYKGYRPDSQEGRMVADMQDVIVILESFYADALADASDNYQAAGAQKNTTREGGVDSKYSIREGMTEEKRYEELKDKKITVRSDNRTARYADEIGSIEALKTKAKGKAEKIIKPLAKKLGIINTPLSTTDVETEFLFTTSGGLAESLHKQLRYGGSYVDFAKTLINLDHVLETAVLIEAHGDKYAGTSRANEHLEAVYVLFGAFRDGKNIIPVQMEIKKSSDVGGRLYLTVAMTKIEADVVGSAPGNIQAPSLVPASEYSLADIFGKINPQDGHFLKYLPDGFLSDEQIKAKMAALEEDASRITGYKKEAPQHSNEIKEKFSLRDTVEETKDLVAVHNLSEEKLIKSLRLGGLPMPSIAILRAQDGHSEFGDISLVFGKDTIDPQAYRSNKLYSGDAYTPTYPKVDYKPSEKVLKKVKDKISRLVPHEVQDALGNLMFDTDNASDNLDRYNGNMVEAYKQNDAMKYAYLKDTGSDISLPMKEADLVRYGEQSNEAVRYFAGKLVNGLQTVEMYQNMGTKELMQDKALMEAVADAQNYDVLRTLEPGSKEYLAYEQDPVFRADEVTFRDIDMFLSASRKLFRNGVQQAVDRNAAREMLKDVDQDAYEGWLRELFSGIVEKEGIRNNKDYFTLSGNRRSFEALHYEHNLENVIKAMREKGEKGLGGFGGGNIFGAATTEFSSVEEMKQARDRLQMLPEEEYQKMREDFSTRFFEMARSLPNNKNNWLATDDAANMLVEAVSRYSTKSGIANYIRRESQGWATYSDYVVDDLVELVQEIRNMPTRYFEAKPRRAVGFDEVATAIVPDSISQDLRANLEEWGIQFVEYAAGDEEARKAALNSLEGVKFSDRDSDGNELSREQQEYFKDSKVRDAQGRLLVMYHGTPNGGFTKFRSGTYFTQNPSYADVYQNPGASSISAKRSADAPMTYKVYLDIQKPFDTRNARERKIFQQEFYRKYGTGTPLADSGLPDWIDGLDLQEFIEEMEYDYDGLILDEGGVGGYGDEVISRGFSYVVFDPTQVKNVDNKTPTDDPDIRHSDRDPELEKVNKVLEKQNEKLKDDVSYLKELLKLQKQVTGGTKFTKSSVEAAAGQLMKYADAKGNKNELAKLLNSLYEYIAKGEDLTWEGVKEAAAPAVEWLKAHESAKKQLDSYAQEVLQQIRGSRIYLDEIQKKEVAYQYGSFNEFRKKMMGSIIITEKNSISLDSQWHEWADMYPNIFDADISTNDMPAALLDAFDTLRNMTYESNYAYDEELITQDLLRQVYDSYWNVSTLYTVADKMQKEINKLKYEHSSRMSTLRKAHREQTAQLKQEHREAVQRVRQAERERGEKKLQDISKRYQESRERGVENRRKTEMRRKIRRTIMELDKLLNRGDKKKNVKEDMKDFVAQALKSADILFTDEYSREDMILNGIGTGLKGQEAKYIAEAREIMEQMGNLPSGSYEAFQQRQEAEARLKGKLAYRMSKLQDVFTRERARLNAAEVSDVLGNLADAYASLEDSEHSYVNGAFHENVYQYLLMLKKDVGGTTVKDMNLNQLEELHKAYTMVLTTVRNANKMFAANMKQTREQLGNQTIAEVRKAGGEKELWLPGEDKINAFFWNNEKPVYAFERIGSSTLARLFENIRAGEDTWAKDMDHARKYYLEQSKKHKYDSWDFNRQYNFTSSSGIDFSLNLEQIMSLYAYSKREQAHDHLMKGGFVFDGNTEVRVSKMGVPVTYLKKTAKAHNVSPEILGDIISKLTSAQKAFVDEMQDYLSTTMGAKGNEVSIQLYGVELFKEKYYFPLRSAGQYKEKAKETDQRREQGQISIVNSGFTKSTTPKSSNSVVLSGFMDVWAEHVNEMSMYHSFVLPMEDFRRVYNYKTTPSENQESVSVNSTIQNAYGEAATKYIDQLYQDLNGGAISDPRESLVKALMGRFKKAAVFASLSVVIQQPSAIGRAFAIIDPKYFVGTKVDNKRHKALWAELKMYAPVASIKEMGYFDTGMGKSAQDFIKGKEYGSLKEKAAALFTDSDYRDELLSKAPALADELTWCAIWDAVKRETKAKNPGMNVKSEEFLQLAGKRFTEVITKTQVYDSVLSRSANMRSKGTFMSMLTAFMAEPTTTINMVEDALRKGKQGDRKYAARTMGAVLCSVILNSALASLVYAMRDDDEDETFLEKYVQSFAVEILDGINPLTYYPFLKDVWSIAQGYDIERADMSLISDLVGAVKKVSQILNKDTEGMDEDQLAAHTKNLANAWWGVVDYVTALVGIPVKNVRRDINGVINTVKTIAADLTDRDASWGSLLDKTWDNVKNSIPVVGWLPDETAADKLYKATVNGDTAYQKRLSSSYSTESALNSAIRKGLRNNDSRIWQAAVAWNNNDLETYKQIAMAIVAEGNFSQDNVVMAIRAEAEALAPDEVENTSASNVKSYFTAEKFAVAIAQSNDAMAAVIKEDIIETAIKNGKTADEAEQSFKSSAKSKLKELFLAGEISEEQAVSALTNYLGLEMEDAESDVGEWTFKAEYPELDGIVSYTQFANWQIYGQSSGVAMETLTDVAGFRKDGTSGNVKSQDEVATYIDSLPISSSQKDALWCCFWKESTLNNAPWHQTE